MIHSKNLNSGFSFIEMMVALTLLAIFGSSIFLVQSNIFSKIFKTHQTAQLNQDVLKELIILKTKIQQTVLQKKDVDSITSHQTKTNPDRTIDLKLYKIPENSILHTTFSKNIRIAQVSVTYENNYKKTWSSFVFIPTLQKETNNTQTTEPSNTPSAESKTVAKR